MDPASWAVLRALPGSPRVRCAPTNPHVIVTKGTKAGRRGPPRPHTSATSSTTAVTDLGRIRSTRLVDLVNTLDPKLVAAAFGMTPEATMIYLADHVDPTPDAPNP